MKKGTKRKAIEKQQPEEEAAAKKGVTKPKAKRVGVPKPVVQPDYFPEKRNLVFSFSPFPILNI